MCRGMGGFRTSSRSAHSPSCWRACRLCIRPGARRACCPPNPCAMIEDRIQMTETGDKVLEGVGLVKEFTQGGVTLQVLRGASIAVGAGERIAIVGASGSRKTTLLPFLGGLDFPTRGTVHLPGRPLNEL